MTLPPLTIPAFPLPFDIPQMVHPLFVHFAIAFPVLVLLLELINLFAKKRTIGVLSFFFMVLISALFLATYLTGSADGKAAKAFLSPAAKEALMAHKQLGIYLVYASGLLMLFKLFSVLIRKTVIRVLFFLVLIGFVLAIFSEGKKGGALVYQYGVNVKSVPAIGKEIKEQTPKEVNTSPVAAVKKETPKAEKITSEVPEANASAETAVSSPAPSALVEESKVEGNMTK